MNKLLTMVVTVLTVIAAVPIVFADTPTVGTGINVGMGTEQFVPRVFMFPERFITHNNADGGYVLVERVENYAFEGEQIHWLTLVWDKNGDDKLADVYVTLSDYGQQPGDGLIEANCDEMNLESIDDWFNALDFFWQGQICPQGGCDLYSAFNVKELEEDVPWNAETMNVYLCTLTVETPNSMYGEYFVTVEAIDLNGDMGTFDENEYWFFNPVLSVSVVGDVDFGMVRPGANAYSDTLLVQNNADPGSGVLLNMYISGTDFYDPANSGAKCPTSNILDLGYFSYFATNGNYETGHDPTRVNGAGGFDEGYYWIPYETGNEFDRQEIIEGEGIITLGGMVYEAGNVLTPGAEIALTFRLYLPEPCNGDFTDGQIFFWGEAI